MKRWLGFYVVVLLVLGLGYLFPWAAFSPGPLSKGHVKQAKDCASCHAPFKSVQDQRCVECHKAEKVAFTGKSKFHEKLKPGQCLACHQGHNVTSKLTFAHNTLPANIQSDCAGCHAKPTDKLHKPLDSNCASCHGTQKFKPAHFKHQNLPLEQRKNCVSCHAKPTDKLHKQLDSNCASCHGTQKFKPADFKHQNLPLEQRKNCVSCHAKPTDNLHRKFSDQCADCHGTQKFKPANFDHDRYFVFDRDHKASCETCHQQEDYKTYTCFGCHEHTPRNIQAEHNEERIYNTKNCAECHPSGNEHDARKRRRKSSSKEMTTPASQTGGMIRQTNRPNDRKRYQDSRKHRENRKRHDDDDHHERRGRGHDDDDD